MVPHDTPTPLMRMFFTTDGTCTPLCCCCCCRVAGPQAPMPVAPQPLVLQIQQMFTIKRSGLLSRGWLRAFRPKNYVDLCVIF